MLTCPLNRMMCRPRRATSSPSVRGALSTLMPRLVLLLSAAALARAAFVTYSRRYLRSRRTNNLLASADRPSVVQWSADPNARAAASEAHAEILEAAWAADAEIAAFSGVQMAQPHTFTTPDGLEMHGAFAWAEGGGLIDVSKPGKRPGVLIVHTAVGPQDLFLRWRAQALATRGYVVLIADLLGDPNGQGWEPTWSADRRQTYVGDGRPLLHQRTRLALDALAADPRVDATRLAAMGYCFGGKAVTDLIKADTSLPGGLRGVVSFHGVVDGYAGEVDEASYSGSQTETSALLCHADADPFVAKEALHDCLSALNARGCKWELQTFGPGGGAKHGFTNPAQVLNEKPQFGYDMRAERASWLTAKDFLENAFA